MERRTYLGILTGGVTLATGGCVMADSSKDPPTNARREVSLENTGSVPDDAPVAFEIEMEDPWITPSSTAAFSITSINKSEKDQSVSPAYYKGTSARDGNAEIVVYNHRANDFEIEAYAPPCFSNGKSETFVRTSGQGNDEEVAFTTEWMLPNTVEPGESRTEDFIVADDPTTEECFSPGSYHFERKHTFEGADVSVAFDLKITAV